MNTAITGLLSIDADAHLKKLTANMFPSPLLLPVELVRCALKRKAATVSVQVFPERMIVSDDGNGIGTAEWQALACLGDPGQNALARERALAGMQDLARPGIGLLAVFYPGARRIKIENAAAAAKNTLRIGSGRIELQDNHSWPRGTRITIERRRAPAAEEKALLAELCASVQVKLFVNGRPLKRKPLLAESLVSLNIHPGEDPQRSALAVPARGDVCRIWLLDQGIPWQVTAVAPIRGMVFSAALETGSPPTAAAMQALAGQALGLYRWLAENYQQFPEPYQSRSEDLLFRQARHDGGTGLLSICAPFRLWHSQRRLSLDDVRRMAASGNLYFIDYENNSSPGGGRERDVLLLTPGHKDFLGNHLRLPLVDLNAHLKVKAKPRQSWAILRRIIAGLGGLARPAAAEITEQSRLRGEENDLCRELEMLWRRQLETEATGKAALPVSVAMIEGRGLFPARRLQNEKRNILLVRRRHPLTLRALQKMAQDRDNCELAFAALMPGHFLTDPR